MHPYFNDWLKVIDSTHLSKVVTEINKIPKGVLCPEYKNIFRAFNLCNYNNLKVVMVGQDPYSQKGVATGLLFGNSKLPLSSSLEIIKGACIDFEIPHKPITFDSTLESWAAQGVLLLNTALTTTVNKVGIHSLMWRPFIASLLTNISSTNNGVIFVLFGKQAQSFEPCINKKTSIILKEHHPVHYIKEEKRMPTTVFKQITKLTTDLYKEPISFFIES